MSTYSDDDRIRRLTEAVQEHDAELAGLVRHWLWSWAVAPTSEDVRDVLSDAFVEAITKLRNNPQLQLRLPYPWFMRFAYFQSLRRARHHYSALEQLKVEEDVLNRFADPTAVDSESKAVIDDAVKSAAGDDLELLLLAAEGHTSDEIAERLGISPELVRQRKSRAVKRVRTLLE